MKGLKLLLPLLIAVMAFSEFALADNHKKHEKKMAMTHVSIMHEVEDADHWLAAWRGENSRHKMFKANGAEHVHTLQDPNNPNLTGLVIAVTDLDALTAFLQSEEGQAAAAEDGVKMDTLVMLVEAK